MKSFYTADNPERNVLFLSKNAILDGVKPIRGGIPLVFPVFGAAQCLPNHGFARISHEWKVRSLSNNESSEDPSIAVLMLESSDMTRRLWPYNFQLLYTIHLFPDTLETKLVLKSTDNATIKFQALLHTYFACDDVRANGCSIQGLHDLQYYDKVLNATSTETREHITIEEETDRVYHIAPSQVQVCFRNGEKIQRTIHLETESSVQSDEPRSVDSDIVIWNPWIEKAKAMTDFGDEEYVNMICIEPGCVQSEQLLHPGECLTLKQRIRVIESTE